MKAIRYPKTNPLHRDIMLVILAGLFSSVALVTLGYMILSQILK